MKIAIIAAMTKNRIIGMNNDLPWKIKAELQYFRNITLNKPIIMGSNTFRSLQLQPLKDRYNIVLTSDPAKLYKQLNKSTNFNNLVLVNSIEDSLIKAKEFYKIDHKINEGSEIMIIGGGKIYQQFLPLAYRLYLSIIKQDYIGNVLFPEYDLNKWKLITSQEHTEFSSQIWEKIIV